ncbi:Cass I SAM-dependent methyltransferase [Candidatus Megaera venefica]|uniref:Cass I SAM-dependent methyltransferase n=1 Tax=Candidatus Megaera venefica TaxID=2055910 RepID=A0ABU5NBN3_9RICK|nr:class I SAM-dependent methyltransferase [Candidatus Megaera venefica]MEA0970585.1 Cass I SAM-dependent methyltransferase [Candidatus Megaera venefica]
MTITKTPRFEKDLKQVQDHYLDYPYPLRNPDDDKKRIIRTNEGFLSNINHHIYNGKQDFKKGYRVLVAGGGTGDSTVWLAKQLMEYPKSEVVYIDFSKKSMDIAKKRAANHGITNITWIEDSILNIPRLKLGKFDYFNCCGVLHHLENPDLGIKILSDVMKEDAGGSIMVYAQYGRTGVYQMQELLRRTGKGIGNRQEKVISAWDVINSLPQTNWYKKGGDLMNGPFDDHELYDRFLHAQDRAYTIPQLYEFVENAGLNIVNFILPYSRASLNIESYFKDSSTKERIKSLPLREQQAICEIMGGNIITHEIYISKQKNTIADFSDLENVPFVFDTPNLCQQIMDVIDKGGNNVMNKYVAVQMKDSHKREMGINLAILPHTKSLFAHLKTGNKSFFEIFEAVRKDTGSKSSDQELWNEFMMNLNPLYSVGSLLLRNKLIKPFNGFLELSE